MYESPPDILVVDQKIDIRLDRGRRAARVSQHASLSPERWARFSLDQQILMIGNEMNRASRWRTDEDWPSLQLSYERVLRLVDLTVEAQKKPTFRRELLRWRDLIAALYIGSGPNPGEHASAFRSLLLLTPAAARQIPFVLAET